MMLLDLYLPEGANVRCGRIFCIVSLIDVAKAAIEWVLKLNPIKVYI